MRLRLYEVGNSQGLVHRLEGFPVTLSITADGELSLAPQPGQPRCVLREDHGNIVVDNHENLDDVYLNDLPIEQGGVMPGDSLMLGDRAFLVSYERVTADPPPTCRFRLAESSPPQP